MTVFLTNCLLVMTLMRNACTIALEGARDQIAVSAFDCKHTQKQHNMPRDVMRCDAMRCRRDTERELSPLVSCSLLHVCMYMCACVRVPVCMCASVLVLPVCFVLLCMCMLCVCISRSGVVQQGG